MQSKATISANHASCMFLMTHKSVTSINHTSLSAEHADGLMIIGLSAVTQEGIFFLERNEQLDEIP